MISLIRPGSGRVVAGVARGIAERYGVQPFVVRVLWVAAMLAAPVTLLLYLLLTISMPAEEAVVSELSVAGAGALLPGRSRFEKISRLLMKRVIREDARRPMSQYTAAALLLLVGAVLELPRLDSAQFYYAHPLVSGLFHILSRVGTAIFYLAAAISALPLHPRVRLEVMLHSPGTPTLQLLQGVRRSIGGLAAGLAQLIRVDAAYIRVFFILLNILTFGAFGVLYVVAVVLLRRKGFAGDTDSSYSPIPSDRATEYDIGSVPASFRWMIGLLFLLLALIRTMTEFRIFFFNEALFHGIILSVMGMLLAWRGLKNPANQHSLLVLAGASVLFLGIEDLTTALFRVQLSSIGGFEVAFVIAALSITYFCLVLLRGLGERISLVFAALCLVAAGMMMMGVIPARFLLALVQFYDFFYPVIFIGFGLWLALD